MTTTYSSCTGRPFVVAVDFDDTCVVAGKRYPEFSGPVPYSIWGLQTLDRAGCKIILLTNREEEPLAKAVEWMERVAGVKLHGVNVNPDKFWDGVRKVYADAYIDDRAVGVPRTYDTQTNRFYVDWPSVTRMTLQRLVDYYATPPEDTDD